MPEHAISTSGVGGEHTNGLHQCFHLRRALRLSPVPAADCSRPENECPLCTVGAFFKSMFFHQILELVRLPTSYLRESVSFSTLGLLDIGPIDFLSQTF